MKMLTWEQVHARRLARNFLGTPAPRTRLAAVVGAVCGLQAQILTAAELGLGVRINGITQADVRRELWERRSLVKTYGPRGTLHLLPASELPVWMAGLRARQALLGTPWHKAPGPPPDAPGLPQGVWTDPMTPKQAEAILEAIERALDGRTLTRDELAAAVGARLGEWAGRRLRSSWAVPPIVQAALTGRLCFGPSRGTQVTFVRADQWIGGWKDVDPQQALLEIVRRYVRAYGPATYQDFAAWFDVRPPQARPLFEALRGELVEVSVEGRRAPLLASDAAVPRRPAGSSVRLIPQYDAYIIGVRQRERIIPDAARQRMRQHPKLRLEGAVGSPWLLIDGLVAGWWERRERGRTMEITVTPFRRLTRKERGALGAEAGRVGRFFGGEAALIVGR